MLLCKKRRENERICLSDVYLVLERAYGIFKNHSNFIRTVQGFSGIQTKFNALDKGRDSTNKTCVKSVDLLYGSVDVPPVQKLKKTKQFRKITLFKKPAVSLIARIVFTSSPTNHRLVPTYSKPNRSFRM